MALPRLTRWQWLALGVLFAAGFAFRVAALSGRGHLGDLGEFARWAEGMASDGLAYYPNGGASNYPPLALLLWPLGILFDGKQLILAIRVLTIPFDLVLGAVLYAMGRELSRAAGERRAAEPPARIEAPGGDVTGRRVHRAGLWAAAAYLLNPAVVVSGPAWGQVDGIGTLPMLLGLWLTGRGRYGWAAAFGMLAALIKPQFAIGLIVLGALLVLRLRPRLGRRQAVRDLAIAGLGAIATFAVVMLPLGLGPQPYLELLRVSAAAFPKTSDGFSPWALVGFPIKDQALISVGALLMVLGILAALVGLRSRRDLASLLGVGTLVGFAMYYLPTLIHERYLFGAVVVLAPLVGPFRRLRLPFIALSLAFAATVTYVLENSPWYPLSFAAAFRFPLDPVQRAVVALAMTGAAAWCVVELRRALWRPDDQRSTATPVAAER